MLRTIIIDDEPNSRDKLLLLVQKYFSDIKVEAVCKSAEEAVDVITKVNPDFIFLDVEMPGMSGFDMLKKISKINFDVIFTTAHGHYAIKAIRFSAVDYLLKPIDIDSLREAIDRVKTKRAENIPGKNIESLVENIRSGGPLENLSIPTSTGLVFVKVGDIIRCESSSNYTIFYLQNKQQAIATRTLKEYEELLDDSGFVRIHHSHLINKHFLKEYLKGAGGQVVMHDGTTLDVSRRKKEEVMEKLKK